MHKFPKNLGDASRCQNGDINKLHNKASHALSVIVQNSVAMASWQPGCSPSSSNDDSIFAQCQIVTWRPVYLSV